MITSAPQDSEVNEKNYSLASNFRYDYSRSCLSIGHRGMGRTFDGTLSETIYIENTIDSFREAFMRGAEMVEFDIVLTKDKIPIVYHDFQFCIGNKEADELVSFLENFHLNQIMHNKVRTLRLLLLSIDAFGNLTSKIIKILLVFHKGISEVFNINLGKFSEKQHFIRKMV